VGKKKDIAVLVAHYAGRRGPRLELTYGEPFSHKLMKVEYLDEVEEKAAAEYKKRYGG
jgi:hypothetical protein